MIALRSGLLSVAGERMAARMRADLFKSILAQDVGWFDRHGDGEFGIALRCAEIDVEERRIRAFAGCGIVAGSDPEDELAESRAKLQPIRSAAE